MKATVPKLLIPLILMTTQQSVAQVVIPPFLHDLRYPVSAIGLLISIGPVFALAARLPSGMIYGPGRARLLMAAALAAVAVCNFLYGFAIQPFQFGFVHALNGFALGAATTLHLAFFVEVLPADQDRHHAMGYYAGSLAIGYSTGAFASGYIADRLGYVATFQVAALLTLAAIVLLAFIRPQTLRATREAPQARSSRPRELLRHLLHPQMATVIIVALFLNLLHQMGSAFLPLYGLAVGLSLTQIGAIKGVYALCNAITRPLSGLIMRHLNSRSLTFFPLPLQSVVMMAVPAFHSFTPILVAFVVIGFMRAVAIVSNTISMVESAEEARIGRGMASGVFHAAGDLGNILGPSAGGLIAAVTGIAYLFFFGPLLFVALFLLSLWGCQFLPRPKHL
jgi:predicted MFS family arabinose efflux permease